MIHFTVPMRPIGTNHAYAPARWGSRHGFRLTDVGQAYKAAVQGAARRAMRGRDLLDGEVEVRLLLAYPDRRSDIDGPIKLTLDAMQGAVYANDRAISGLTVCRVVDKARPRVEVSVVPFAPDATSLRSLEDDLAEEGNR